MLYLPEDYDSKLSLRDTEKAIKQLKDFFQIELSKTLNLSRVSAPLFVFPDTGINDDLNGTERPVSFDVKGINNKTVEVVHSLAKWKRWALKRYKFKSGEGIYTDMNAIRRDEDLDNLHSIYVDQWDWEIIIEKNQRSKDTLKNTVLKIYDIFKKTNIYIKSIYPQLDILLPDNIKFITTQQLEDIYPNLSPKERENKIAKEYKSVFLMQIGANLKSGKPHDGRAPDYDDWSLNGDILFWNSLLNEAFEVSSMGIRVDEDTLLKQLKQSNCENRTSLPFHKALLNKELPYTMGGGIGQSRMCMYFLQKAHIGEVQASIWSQKMLDACEKANITLL